MRIGLSGTNWTGKSTTARLLAEQTPTASFDQVSLSKIGSGCPFPMQEDQTLDASRWMAERVQSILDSPVEAQIQLFDRTPIDILAFTRLAADQAGSDADESVYNGIVDLLQHFDSLYYLPFSDAWPTIEVVKTPRKVAFALLMDRYMQTDIRELSIEVVILPWELEARISLLKRQICPE